MTAAPDLQFAAEHTNDARTIASVSAAHFVSHVYILLLPPLFEVIRADYQLSYTELGLALVAFNALTAVFQTPAGFLVDHVGARIVLICGLLLGSAAVVVAGVAVSFWVFVAMFALAGNHDWYDGLTGFLRLFCQRRWIGGWKTRQRRSYFALRLPHHWWLLGTDFQLHSDIDQPQNDYFREVAEEIREDPDARVLPTIEGIRRVTRMQTGQDVSATSMLERFGFTGDKLTGELRAKILEGIPMNRLGDAEDVARACLFLASDLASYTTGAVIDVNGGMLIH